MVLDPEICERARLARDARFDGLFFTGVPSTGIYCRPVCPARAPKPQNVVYYPTAAAAAAAGLRPCRRCRPEAAPGTPAWSGTSGTVARALNLIRQGALDEGSAEDLALRLGVGQRHLRRLFKQHVGASPLALAGCQRLFFAHQLLMETELSITQIALTCGYGSIRRFHAAFRNAFGQTPSDLRHHRREHPSPDLPLFCCTLRLPYRPPYDWQAMLAFFQQRAIPQVEIVAGDAYHRTLRTEQLEGVISVRHAEKEHALELAVSLTGNRGLMGLVARVRRMFDLDANLPVIHHTLVADPELKQRIDRRPGLRLPGAWDPFETTVRAVVGQQISVKGALTLLGRMVDKNGSTCRIGGHPALTRYFPLAHELVSSNLDQVGMPALRKNTLRLLAGAVAAGDLRLEATGELSDFIAAMKKIPGIGDWTAHYVAMRALGEPDAFPASDLGIAHALQQAGQRPTPKQILARAENWRPWRAYAAVHLWHS
jgi:AraC family transcriptional regulator, regulatory protein of adaptative response / DNA-3-methyladenine glycosylase II